MVMGAAVGTVTVRMWACVVVVVMGERWSLVVWVGRRVVNVSVGVGVGGCKWWL